MNKMVATVVAVVVLAVAVSALYIAVLQPIVADNLGSDSSAPSSTITIPPIADPSLSPIRSLAGQWQTSNPVKFQIKTDFASGQLDNVGSENRTMTWTITKTSNQSEYNIEVRFIASSRQLIEDSGYTPDVSPMFLRATVDGDTLTLHSSDTGKDRILGSFTYTNDIIRGTWDDHWKLGFEQEVYTAQNGLTLMRQW